MYFTLQYVQVISKFSLKTNGHQPPWMATLV